MKGDCTLGAHNDGVIGAVVPRFMSKLGLSPTMLKPKIFLKNFLAMLSCFLTPTWNGSFIETSGILVRLLYYRCQFTIDDEDIENGLFFCDHL
ncbi:MAG: hypothetical protein OXE59_05955 [Bacteroidetes bacterium]|nr:hypothetical protein [Bacteroidota bacterium]MCY4233269.1 hypothetical protein [Bacteroidota bacterium]